MDSPACASPCSLIVTDGDMVLCEECYREGICEQDPWTHFYAKINHGECESCGVFVSKANDKKDKMNDCTK